jgi:hypothetical protein
MYTPLYVQCTLQYIYSYFRLQFKFFCFFFWKGKGALASYLLYSKHSPVSGD